MWGSDEQIRNMNLVTGQVTEAQWQAMAGNGCHAVLERKQPTSMAYDFTCEYNALNYVTTSYHVKTDHKHYMTLCSSACNSEQTIVVRKSRE